MNIGKQHREAIPKKSEWRATEKLQFIHTDLCGPISPTSQSGKRGGEYTSNSFNQFCEAHGIKRQLTAAYTPKQNGVAEKRYRTIMIMVICLLAEKEMPKHFWPEAAKWACHTPYVPKFDGDYGHWRLIMENLLRSKEYWCVIEPGYKEPGDGEQCWI
ncbi:retrovirus-related pol polyprotein from transposon TNT 1-94, partial [Tanacetum coccineum]